MTGTIIKAEFAKVFENRFVPKQPENPPRIRFHVGRDYIRGPGWEISVSWGLIPAEDRKEGECVYRRCWELSFFFGGSFYRR